MNQVLISTAYIKHLLDSNPNIQCIEVWSRVLYARMKKGHGRNKFISKKGLEFSLPVYYYESEYIALSKSYHPDKLSAGKKQVQKQSTYTKLIQNINVSRPALSELFKGRRGDGISFTHSNECFTKFSSTSSLKRANILVEQIEAELSKAGYCDSELFGGYCTNPLDESIQQQLRSINDSEEEELWIVQTWVDSLRKQYQEERNDIPF